MTHKQKASPNGLFLELQSLFSTIFFSKIHTCCHEILQFCNQCSIWCFKKIYICGWNRCPLRHKYYISVYLETVTRLLKSVGMGVSSREGFQQWRGSFDEGLYIYGFLLLRFLACFLNDNCRWKLEYFVNNCDVLWIWHLNGHKMVCEWTYLWKLSIQLFQLTHPLSQNAPSING